MNNFKQHDQLWRGRVKTLNNLSYFSAGAISLSITFLGYILSIGTSARNLLQETIIGKITILWILFGSWVFLFLTVFFGIVVQFFIDKYIFDSQTALLYEDFKTTVREEDKKNVDLVIDPAKASAEKLRKTSRWVQGITVCSFGFGVFLLALFAVLVASKLVSI